MMLLATVSCQKNEKADPMPEPVEESTPEQPMTKASFAKEEHNFGTMTNLCISTPYSLHADAQRQTTPKMPSHQEKKDK